MAQSEYVDSPSTPIIMYALPERFDGGFLLKREIETISFGRYQVNITLTGGIWLQIEGRYEHRSAEGKVFQKGGDSLPEETKLTRLLGKLILDVKIFDNRDILLEVSSGDRLFVYGDNGMYEAYRIFDGIKEVVV